MKRIPKCFNMMWGDPDQCGSGCAYYNDCDVARLWKPGSELYPNGVTNGPNPDTTPQRVLTPREHYLDFLEYPKFIKDSAYEESMSKNLIIPEVCDYCEFWDPEFKLCRVVCRFCEHNKTPNTVPKKGCCQFWGQCRANGMCVGPLCPLSQTFEPYPEKE